MIASIDTRYDLDIYLEYTELEDLKQDVLEGMLVRGKKVVPLLLAVDDAFAIEQGNRRIGARFLGDMLEVKLSIAVYKDLIREKIFSERYTLCDGSKICIGLADDARHIMHYHLLQDEIALLEGFEEFFAEKYIKP